MKSKHGILRGLNSVLSKSAKSTAPSFDGKFGRMFPTLPKAVHDRNELTKLATFMVAGPDVPPTPETESDDEENSGISAGYTYLGQFIDHDLTFDPASSLQKENDINALTDYRTPKFDLDNVYGRGPDDQPYLYDDDGIKFLLGKKIGGNPEDPNTHDLVRSTPIRGAHRAIIGDPRNDENQIVSQLQGMFLRFHNSIVDFKRGLGEVVQFSDVQKLVRWHYQWVVINDFLPTIIRKDVIEDIFPHLKKKTDIQKDKPKLTLFNTNNSEPFMPVEFSVAAYRFGHSMIRPVYRLNQHRSRFFIFPDLTGFDTVADDLAIDWKLFFDFGNKPNQNSSQRIQPAYKIDTSLVDPLGHLPSVIASNPSSLAARNLLRGLELELPSGQEVAKALKVPVISDKDLKVGKANVAGSKPGDEQNKSIADLGLSSINENAPLWFYILAEALHDFNSHKPIDDNNPVQLGQVGGRIVGEVFAWLLLKDSSSVIYAKDKDDKGKEIDWRPIKDFTKKGEFGIAELITQAQKA